MPKDIHIYRITGEQDVNTPWSPSNPSATVHLDEHCDKSSWSIDSTSVEVIDHNETTGLTKVRVWFMVTLPRNPPPGFEVQLSEAKVEVYDPDTEFVTDADAPLAVGEMQYVDIDIPVEKDGEYCFLVCAKDQQYPGEYITNKAWEGQGHEIRPLLQQNSQADLGAAVCMYHGAQVPTSGIKAAWTRIKQRWVKYAGGRRYKVVAGQMYKDDKWQQISNPAYEHASVAHSSLAGGARNRSGSHFPPEVWVIFAHGGDAPYESKLLVCRKGWLHKCAIAANSASVSGLSGWDFAYVSSLQSLSEINLVVLAGCSSSKKDSAAGGSTIGDLLRQKGVSNVLGFSRPVSAAVANWWLRDFFDQLCAPFIDALPLDYNSIHRAAVQSQDRTIEFFGEKAGRHPYAVQLGNDGFVVHNGVRIPSKYES